MKKYFLAAFTAIAIILSMGTMAFFLSMGALAFADATDTGFSDVDSKAWYADAVGFCRDNGLIGGTSDTGFEPNAETTRAMLVTILYRQAGSPAVIPNNSFADVQKGTWYSDAVDWAEEGGVINGYENGYFGTNDPVTREQIAAILWRSAGSPQSAEGNARFLDEGEVSPYAMEAVGWAKKNSIINGRRNNCFEPQGNATRAETSAMLYRYLNDSANDGINDGDNTMTNLSITIGSKVFFAELYNNKSTQAFIDRLPITADMGEMNGNEKYCYMPAALPTTAVQPGNINAGDLMLYGDDCLVLFYKDFQSSYSYTKLGNIQDAAGLSEALGSGNVQVTFSVVH